MILGDFFFLISAEGKRIDSLSKAKPIPAGFIEDRYTGSSSVARYMYPLFHLGTCEFGIQAVQNNSNLVRSQQILRHLSKMFVTDFHFMI